MKDLAQKLAKEIRCPISVVEQSFLISCYPQLDKQIYPNRKHFHPEAICLYVIAIQSEKQINHKCPESSMYNVMIVLLLRLTDGPAPELGKTFPKLLLTFSRLTTTDSAARRARTGKAIQSPDRNLITNSTSTRFILFRCTDSDCSEHDASGLCGFTFAPVRGILCQSGGVRGTMATRRSGLHTWQEVRR